ncbi:hypothetical protein [Nonomuraea rubra]|uniref:hypothetical protein n=1 Tax=Nonomuraea rubra TaxID=46180 RepID=UPI0031E85868
MGEGIEPRGPAGRGRHVVGTGGTALATPPATGPSAAATRSICRSPFPIDISGNSAAAIGKSEATSQGGAEVVNQGRPGIPQRHLGQRLRRRRQPGERADQRPRQRLRPTPSP